MSAGRHLTPEQYAAYQVGQLATELRHLVRKANRAVNGGRKPAPALLARIEEIKSEIKRFQRGDFTTEGESEAVQ